MYLNLARSGRRCRGCRRGPEQTVQRDRGRAQIFRQALRRADKIQIADLLYGKTGMKFQQLADLLAKCCVVEEQRSYQPAHIGFNDQKTLIGKLVVHNCVLQSIPIGGGQLRCP